MVYKINQFKKINECQRNLNVKNAYMKLNYNILFHN